MNLHLKKNDQLSSCLACRDGVLKEDIFEIKDLPLVDAFKKNLKDAKRVPESTIKLKVCSNCKTIQIDNPINPAILYDEYIYDSSSSPDLEKHFTEYTNTLINRKLVFKKKILEIGVNDGLLAKKLISNNCSNFLGIDPSPQTKKIKDEKIEIINGYFGSKEVMDKLNDFKFDLIVANNVFSHIPNMSKILDSAETLLTNDGVLVFEIQSVRHLLENVVFDYIYHEHIFYHSLLSLRNLLLESNLDIFDVEFKEVKGGSFRVYACKKGKKEINSKVKYEIFKDELFKVNKYQAWELLDKNLNEIKEKLDIVLESHQGRVIGYGASATGTVLQRYFGLEKYISDIVDDNKNRQGLYSPKYGKPIISSDQLNDDSVVLILAWRHIKHIVPKLRGKVFIPLPFFDNVRY